MSTDPSKVVAETSSLSLSDRNVSKEEKFVAVVPVEASDISSQHSTDSRPAVPLKWKLISFFLVALVSFGGSWSARLTSSMKSTIKRELKINNTQFALLEASEEFMATVLMMLSGFVTDRVGGAKAMLYGNVILTAGGIVIAGAATAKSYKLMILGRVIAAFGDIATQIAQYKIFSSWFPTSGGFATTLGTDLAFARIGGFVGSSTANVIAKNTGNFAWVFWISVMISLFTNITTVVFFFVTKTARKRFSASSDPATGEELTESNKKFELKKVLHLPWTFWLIMLFSMMQTSCSNIYSQNATELAEHRFGISAVTAGWYASLSQYSGFFLSPFIGMFIDVYGNRLSAMMVCGSGMLISMGLINWSTSTAGAAASYATFAVFRMLGPTTIIDGIRTSVWHQSVFGSAYAAKVTMNNATNIITRILTGAIQDMDNNSYDRVTIVYVFLATGSTVMGLIMLVSSFWAVDLGILQYTRKKRVATGSFINERKHRFYETKGARNRIIGRVSVIILFIYVLCSWAAYFWGIATGNNA